MQLNVLKTDGASSDQSLDIPDILFAVPFNEALVHQIVIAQLAGARAGTHAQKTRSQVRGGGRKPWKQKGTGQARAGTIRSPLWRGGGKIFAATTSDYSQKVNKKMYRGAMRSVISELVRQGRLTIVDQLVLGAPKTKDALKVLSRLGVQRALFLVDKVDLNFALAVRNIPHIDLQDATSVDPVSLIRHEKVFATVDAIKRLEERLA